MEDEEEDEDAEVEIVDPKPATPHAGSLKKIHIPTCDACQRSGKECTGMPGRTCDLCTKLKTRCSKSTGRGGKPRKVVVAAPGPKRKGKEKAKEKEKGKEKVPGTCDILYPRFWSEVR